MRGPAARGSTISGSALHVLVGALLDACQGAVRLAFERRSTSSAEAAPDWLDHVADFDLLAIEDGSTRLLVEARPLATIVPGRPTRAAGADATAFDLFLAGLRDAVGADANSDRYDMALLDTYRRLGQLFRLGFEAIELGDPPCRLDAAVLDSIAKLRQRIPMPRQVRVAGRLELHPYDVRAFSVRLADGVVHGMASTTIGTERLAALSGAQVIVSGLAVFRASGAVLRLEAHHIDEADERASVWAHTPRPLFEAAEPVARYRVRQDPQTGLAAIMGKWPGDETDEEIAALLEQLS